MRRRRSRVDAALEWQYMNRLWISQVIHLGRYRGEDGDGRQVESLWDRCRRLRTVAGQVCDTTGPQWHRGQARRRAALASQAQMRCDHSVLRI
jgi:hypothetical protein